MTEQNGTPTAPRNPDSIITTQRNGQTIVEGGNAMILEAIYNGEFYPCETVVPTSPEYRKAIQTCAALMEQLSQRLSKEDYALGEELRAQNAIAQCEESESHFKYGFSAGLIVQQEAHEQLQNKK